MDLLNPLELPPMGWSRLVWGKVTQFSERTFDLLADVAGLHKGVDVVSYGLKPEMLRDGVKHSSSIWML